MDNEWINNGMLHTQFTIVQIMTLQQYLWIYTVTMHTFTTFYCNNIW